ncbi:MAG: hypothetical protein AB7Y46_12940 [Armatimonadota bacterium]
MRVTLVALIAALIAVSALTVGCGGGDGNGSSTSYLPMEIGNTWTYTLTLAPGLTPEQITDGLVFPYHETVIGVADLQGTRYHVIRARREAVGQYPERTWQQYRRVTAQAIYARVGDPAYDLPILKLPPAAGETWTDPQFPEVAYRTAATAEQVTVPAGTFACVRVEQQSETVPNEGESPVQFTVRSWYARGVGVVRDETLEDGELTSTLELESYSVQ